MTLAAALCRKMRGHFVTLAMHKYSSNVVEKCALWAGAERRLILDELFFSPSLPALLQDSYANYVVQTALQSAHPRERRRLVMQVRPHLAVFRAPHTAPAVFAKWTSILDRLQESATDGETSLSGTEGEFGSEFSDSDAEGMRHSGLEGLEDPRTRFAPPAMSVGKDRGPRPPHAHIHTHAPSHGHGHRDGGGGGGGGYPRQAPARGTPVPGAYPYPGPPPAFPQYPYPPPGAYARPPAPYGYPAPPSPYPQPPYGYYPPRG